MPRTPSPQIPATLPAWPPITYGEPAPAAPPPAAAAPAAAAPVQYAAPSYGDLVIAQPPEAFTPTGDHRPLPPESAPETALEIEDRRRNADREAFAALVKASRQNAVMAEPKPRTTPAPSAARSWLLSVLVLVIIALAVFFDRHAIMAIWPPSIRFFAFFQRLFH